MMPETPVLHASASRTVREVVHATPGVVTDAWCRQLIADLLRAVESQHALHSPHRIIMPDTVLVGDHGAATLLAPADDEDDDAAQLQPPVAADLRAVAAVAYFAISGESPPAGALAPRAPPAISAGLLQAIDACLYGERAGRPQSVDDMRRLMGIAVAAPSQMEEQAPAPAHTEEPAPPPASVADELEEAIAGLAAAVGVRVDADMPPEPLAGQTYPAPAATAPAAVAPAAMAPDLTQLPAPAIAPPVMAAVPLEQPAPAAAAKPPAPVAPVAAAPRRATPWLLLACLAIGLLGAGGFALYERGRQAGAEAVLAATPPQGVTADAAPAATAVPVADAAAAPSAIGAVTETAQAAAPAMPPAPATPPARAAATSATAATAATAATPASITYQLRIKPWGEIYVDGVKRGISPPLKTLTLTGQHNVRIVNPDFPSQEMTVGGEQDNSTRIDHDFR